MNAIELLTHLEQSGVSLSTNEGNLVCRPATGLPQDIRDAIRAHKEAILGLLKERNSLATQAGPKLREYEYSDGRPTLVLTDEEFNGLVDVFRILLLWSREDS